MKIFKNFRPLNDSNFYEEGEYILEQKPKYIYEIKIVHDHLEKNNKLKSKTPDKITSSNKVLNYNHFHMNQRRERIKPYTKNDVFGNSYEDFKNKESYYKKKIYNIAKESYEKIEDEIKQQKRIKYFKHPLKIEKQIQQYIHPMANKNIYHISEMNLNNFTNFKNNNIIHITSHKNQNNKLKPKNKTIFHTPDKNIHYIHKNTNNSFISIYDSNQKNHEKNNISTKLLKNKRKNNNNKELMIHKSSERNEIIKSIPLDKKIKPLILKRKVFKPILETLKIGNHPPRKIMKQTSILTSIETNPLYLTKNNSFQYTKEKLIKEKITNVYTTLSKSINDNIKEEINQNKLNKSFDQINIYKYRKKPINKKLINNHSLRRKNYILDSNYNNNENIYINKDNFIYKKGKNNSSLINYSSITSNLYEPIESNNIIGIKAELQRLKYLYYRCTNLNSNMDNKLESLKKYFLNLRDEEKIGILTNLNDSGEENEKMYKKLINILKKKGANEESFE